jgi:hypothetical protein
MRIAPFAAAADHSLLNSIAASTVNLSSQPPSGPIFVFETNEFWLNLHHFL